MDDLEERYKKAVLNIASHVSDIKHNVKDMNHKLSHFLRNYREDYYEALDGIKYQKQLKEYQR